MKARVVRASEAKAFDVLGLTIAPGNLTPMFGGLAGLPPGEPDAEAIAAICEKFGIRFV